MPANFTEMEKQKIFTKLYEEGYKALQTYGFKKMNIRHLAKAVGIATGTFYNFFPGKEDFVYHLILKKRDDSLSAFTRLSDKYPNGIPCSEASMFFYQNLKNNNIYQFLTEEECNLLIDKLHPDTNDHLPLTGEFIMSRLATDKGENEYSLFSESYKILIIGTSDTGKINNTLLDITLKPMVEAACQLLY